MRTLRRGRKATLGFVALLVSCARTAPENPLVLDLTASARPAHSTPVLDATPSSAPGSQGPVDLAYPIVVAAYPGVILDPIEHEWNRKLGEQLTEATGLEFQVVKPMTFGEIVDGLSAGLIHVAPLPPLAYMVAEGQGSGDVALLVGDARTARPALSGVMFIGDSRVGLVEGGDLDMFESLTPCWQRDFPEAGYLVPAAILSLHGVSLSEPQFVADEPELIQAIYDGRCQFGATWEYPFPFHPSDWQLPGMPDVDRVVVPLVATEPVIPADNITISRLLPRAVWEATADALLQLSSTPEGLVPLGLGFPAGSPWSMVIGKDTDYDAFRRYLFAVGGPSREMIPSTYFGVEPAPTWTAAPVGTVVLDVGPISSEFIPFSGSNALALDAMTSSLVRLGGDGTLMPVLAERVPTMESGARLVGQGEDSRLEVEFRLRQNAKWQDGHRLTGQDLAFSWRYIMDPEFPSDHLTDLGWAPEIFVHSVDAIAPDRVVYEFMSPREVREAAVTGGALGDPAPYEALANGGPVVPLDYWAVGRYVLPQHLLADVPPGDFERSAFVASPVYAGPYRLAEIAAGGIVLEANQDFVLGRPRIDRVVMGARYFTAGALEGWQSSSLLDAAFQSGAIQAQLGLPAVNTRLGEDMGVYDRIASQDSAEVVWVPRDSWEVLDFNLDNPHLEDRRVREAIALAIDRQALVDRLFQGRAGMMGSYLPVWHPLYPGDDALPVYAYSPDRARAILQDAGYDLSQMPAVHPIKGPLVLDLASWDVIFYPRRPIAEFIRDSLREIGIEVDIQMYGREFEGTDCSAVRNGRRFDLGMAAWVGIARIPVVWAGRTTLTDSIPSEQNGCPLEKANWSGWRSPEADSLFETTLRNGLVALEDPDGYSRAWAEHQRLWATDIPSLPLFNSYRPVTVSTRLRGLDPSPFAFGGGVEDTWNVYQWELIP